MNKGKKSKRIYTMLLILCMIAVSIHFPVTSKAASIVQLEMYNSTLTAQTNKLDPNFKLTNTSSSSIDLSNIKIKYYYTIDGNQAQNFNCYFSSVGTSNITNTFVNIPATSNADCYLEVGFTTGAGSLAAGDSVNIQTSINKTDWSNYNQANDYSFNANDTNYVTWDKSAVYENDTLICGNSPELKKFLIIVSSPLYQTGAVASKINTYVSDLTSEGWASSIIKVNNVTDSNADYICKTPSELKNAIKGYYNAGYEGFVIVGSSPAIPTAKWESKPNDTDYSPTDLYYADMNDWTDSDGDGIYESFDNDGSLIGGDFKPEMFYGRISAAGISDSITTEASKICSYFDKIHNYRVNGGNLSEEQKNRVFLFYDCKDFKQYDDQERFKCLGTEIDGVYDDSLTTPERLKAELEKGYAFVNYDIHSANDYHQVRVWDSNDNLNYNNFTLDDVNSISGGPKVNNINMYSCSACRFEDPRGNIPNFGQTYLFNGNYVINVTGSTGSWGLVPDATYYQNIADGKPIGIAYQQYFQDRNNDMECPKALLCGDPTMCYKVPHVTNKAPHITTNLAGSSFPNSPRLEITDKLEINATDPENDNIIIDVTGLPAGAVVKKESGKFTWTTNQSDANKIYNLTATAYNKDSNNNIINKYVETFTVKVEGINIIHPGFEDGLNGWKEYAYDDQHGYFSSDSLVKCTGQSSACIFADDNNDCRIAQTIAVTPNTNYCLSGYVKACNVESGKGACVCAEFSQNNVYASEGVIGDTDGWKKVSVDFYTGNNTSVEIQARLGMYGLTSSGTAYFDNLILVKKSPTVTLSSLVFDNNNMADIDAAINFNGYTLTSIYSGGNNVVWNKDYGSIDAGRGRRLYASFLSTLPAGDNEIEFNFNSGKTVVVHINVIAKK